MYFLCCILFHLYGYFFFNIFILKRCVTQSALLIRILIFKDHEGERLLTLYSIDTHFDTSTLDTF